MDSIIANITITLMGLVIVATLGVTIYSVQHSLRVNKRKAVENGVPVSIIGWSVVATLLVIALTTWMFCSFADMCIITAGTMLLIAAGSVAYAKVMSVKMRKRNVSAQK